jgi:hypothetical protein
MKTELATCQYCIILGETGIRKYFDKVDTNIQLLNLKHIITHPP